MTEKVALSGFGVVSKGSLKSLSGWVAPFTKAFPKLPGFTAAGPYFQRFEEKKRDGK